MPVSAPGIAHRLDTASNLADHLLKFVHVDIPAPGSTASTSVPDSALQLVASSPTSALNSAKKSARRYFVVGRRVRLPVGVHVGDQFFELGVG
eukprot:3699032-Rhodomonas_salina.4